MYAVITDRTPSRCNCISIHESEERAEAAAERLDTGINGMPAEVLEVRDGSDLEPGERAWHDGAECWSGNDEPALACRDYDPGAPHERMTR